MKFKLNNLVPILGAIILLTACFGNDTKATSSADYNPNLGSLIAESEIGSYSIESLQNALVGISGAGVCNGLQSTSDTNCIHAINLINHNKSKFGNIIVESLVTTTATSLGIKSVKAYQLQYTTSGAPIAFAGNTRQTQRVSGLVLLPRFTNLNDAATKVKGIVLYYHPTIFDKYGVPSFDNSEGEIARQMLAAIYATQGYIVVAPDYLGQGVNAQIMHPYVLYPQANAKSGIYMLKALKAFMQQESYAGMNESKLFITSYSEGGPYALWASKLLQTSYAEVLSATNLGLKRTVGISGAYDLSGATIHYEFANTTNVEGKNPYFIAPAVPDDQAGFFGPGSNQVVTMLTMSIGKLALFNYVLAAYMNYTANLSGYKILMNHDFVDMNSCGDIAAYIAAQPKVITNCLIESQHYTLNQLLSSSKLLTPQIQMQLFSSAYGTTKYFSGDYSFNDLVGALESGYANNSVGLIANPNMLTEPLVMDFVAEQNIYNWTTTSPISLISLESDSVVTRLNTDEACATDKPSLFTNSTSKPKLVTCERLNNVSDKYVTSFALPGFEAFPFPVYLDHSTAEPILQLMALHQIATN